MSSLFSQAMKPIQILSVLLFVYTLTVISRVPHSVLNEMGHRKRDVETVSTAKADVFKTAAGGKATGQIESNGIALNPHSMEGADQSLAFDESEDCDLESEEAREVWRGHAQDEVREIEVDDFDPVKEYNDIYLPPVEIHSIEPGFAPRAGGIAAIVRGTGFSALTTTRRQIERKLQVLIEGGPCDETRWVSDQILKCLIPTGTGVNLGVSLSPCSCTSEKKEAEEAVTSGGAVTFSYTEDLLKAVVTETPALELIPNHKVTGIQMNANQLVSPHNLEVAMRTSNLNHEDSPDLSLVRAQLDSDAPSSTYAVLPEMSRVLPEDDWRIRHTTCAVVGKSGSLFGSKLGSTIDRHSGVFRIDNAPSGSKFLADVGKKVTYQVLHASWAEVLLGSANSQANTPHVARWWLDTAAVVLWAQQSQSQYVQLKYLYPEANVVMLSRDFDLHLKQQAENFARRLVSSGLADLRMLDLRTEDLGSLLHAISMALQICEKVDIYGVFPRCGRHSRCRQTFFDLSELTAKEKVAHDLELKFLMALGALNMVNTTTPVKMRDDGKLIKHPSLTKKRNVDDGTCDDVMCRASSSSSPFQCTKHSSLEESESCQCEKTWGGKFCERDLLELGSPSLASRVMKGINLNFHGSLLMSKENIKWRQQDPIEDEETGELIKRHDIGYIELPEGTTKNRTVQGDYYEMNRHMYNLLPENDEALVALLDTSVSSAAHSKRVTRKVDTCAVIGNSGSLLHTPLGEEIDNHTMVYRFNQAPTAGFERYTGVKTTHESLNSAWAKALVDTIDGASGSNNQDPDDPNPVAPQKKQSLAKGNRWRWRKKDTALVLFEMFDLAGIMQHNREQNYNKDRWWKKNLSILRSEWPDKVVLPYNPLFVIWAYHRYDAFKRRFEDLGLGQFPGEKPMSGFYAILFLLQACDQLDLYGFEAYMESTGSDLMGTKYHYFDDAVPRHNSHSFDLTQYIYRAIAFANPGRLRIRS